MSTSISRVWHAHLMCLQVNAMCFGAVDWVRNRHRVVRPGGEIVPSRENTGNNGRLPAGRIATTTTNWPNGLASHVANLIVGDGEEVGAPRRIAVAQFSGHAGPVVFDQRSVEEL